MTKKQRAALIIDLLEKEYPLADCTLDYDEAWKLLVSVRLAAQCTDARVNIVVKDLYEKYPSPAALAAASVEEIEAIVKPCGLGHSKARDIHKCMNMLMEQYGGRHTPFMTNYRPQFYFRTTDVTGVITLPEGVEMCMPGDNVEMSVELITPIAIEEGLRFAIREGGRTVGSGVVTAINA